VRELRVLIAEEMEFVASRLSAQLDALGHHVLGVVRDQAAMLASASSLEPDLLLLDLHLPPLGGIEAARAILARRAMPLVLVADYGVDDHVRRAQEAGVLAHLLWPSDVIALESALTAALTRFGEFRILCEQVGDLQQALRTRVVLEHAKALLMRRLDLGEAEAFQYMNRRSRDTGRPLGETAARLLAVEQQWFGQADLAGCINLILGVLAKRRPPWPWPRKSPRLSRIPSST